MIINATRQKLLDGGLTLGFGVHHLRTAATGMIAESTDHDWLFLDMEHGAFSVNEVTQICLSALLTGVTPIVRVCAGALHEGTRALDNGAQGVIVPHVDTLEQAELVARTFRYPPRGTRSWGGPPAVLRFQPTGNAEAQAAIDPDVLVVAMIESPQAVDAADQIAGVDGIDVLLIGTSDLTAEMGISGQIGHPRVRAAYETVANACKARGKVMGMAGVYDTENATHYIRLGARFILSGMDHAFLQAGARERSATLRAAN